MKSVLLGSAFALTLGPAAHANDYLAVMQAFLEDEVRTWAQSEELTAAIQAQNAITGGYSQGQIDELDTSWRAATDTPSDALIAGVMTNAASEFLRSQVAGSYGLITEVFIMDARGLNVAASDVTSDYWQGDEAKFTETYPLGPDAEHFSDIEFDESTQSYQAQMSITITDPATGEPIGAMTIGVNADAL